MGKFLVPTEFISLLPDFLHRREQDLASLQKAALEKDYQAILFIAHQLKGLGSSYGFHEVSQIGEKLELSAHFHKDKEIEFWITHLSAVIKDISNEIFSKSA